MAGGRRDPARVAGPDAERVGGPRPAALVGWGAGIAAGIAAVAASGSAASGTRGAVIAVGIGLIVVCAAFLTLVLRTRLYLHGTRLHMRTAFGWAPPVDLDRLESARIVFFRTSLIPRHRCRGKVFRLIDHDGNATQVDAVNQALGPLYRAVDARIQAAGITVDGPTRQLLDRFRG
jgi:hypothetical protein